MDEYQDEKVLKKLANGYQSTDFIDISREAMGDDYEEKVRPRHL